MLPADLRAVTADAAAAAATEAEAISAMLDPPGAVRGVKLGSHAFGPQPQQLSSLCWTHQERSATHF